MTDLDYFSTLLPIIYTSEPAEDINITLPSSNNLFKTVKNCFTKLSEIYKEIKIYLIGENLFQFIKSSCYFIDYEEDIQHYSVNGRRLSMLGSFMGADIIIDSSLKGHNYGWFICLEPGKNFSYTRHKLIVS